MKTRILIFATLIFAISSCDVIQQVANDLDTSGISTSTGTAPLTNQEIISGLKEALRVSSDTAVAIVSKPNGFFGDQLIKIGLPPEANIIMENKDNAILQAVGISAMIDDVVLRMNRAAEESSKKAGTIFLNSIKSMSFSDAYGILKGGDTAATHFFRMNSYNQLYAEFNPVINKYLDEALVGGMSTNQAWNNLTSVYNKAAQFSSSLTPVNTKLDDYATRKAIDGLFVKLAEEEKQIRQDPVARVTDILQRVFN
jgi:hypothetical protein